MERESQEMSREKAKWEERLHKASKRQREAVEVSVNRLTSKVLITHIVTLSIRIQMCVDLRTTCDQYRTEHAQSIRLCGHLLTQVAMAKAQSKIQEGMLKEKSVRHEILIGMQYIIMMSSHCRMSHKSVEVRKLKKIVTNYTHLLQVQSLISNLLLSNHLFHIFLLILREAVQRIKSRRSSQRLRG